MKIGVLSDIHANKYALKRVLETAKKLDVRKFLILGDNIGYYYDPESVFEMLSKWDCEYIRGNHEVMFLRSLDDSSYLKVLTEKYGSSYNHALRKLTNAQVELIRNMPENRKLVVDNVSIFMCHGSPNNYEQYVYPDAPLDVLNNMLVEGVDFVLTGHTHHKLFYTNNNTTLINFGSVGQCRATGGIAEWGIIDTDNRVARNISTSYDPGELAKKVEKYDPALFSLKDVLYRNN